MQMYSHQHHTQHASQWSSSTSRERMALPPITLAVASTTPHSSGAEYAATPVMMMVQPCHRPMMLSPSGVAVSPAFAHIPHTSCSPAISKKRIRTIPNATKSITLDLLRPHFDRPLAEVANMFGICMTLMKKICRKNGVPRWPHRQIRGLRKSIWSIEKALRSCDSEMQRRSYLEHLDKQNDKLAAILRGPDGPGCSTFHELVMSVPCSPMSELATPKTSAPTPLVATETVTETTIEQRASSPVTTSAARPALPTTAHTKPAFAPSPCGVETPTITRLPSIASLLAAHANGQRVVTPLGSPFQC